MSASGSAISGPWCAKARRTPLVLVGVGTAAPGALRAGMVVGLDTGRHDWEANAARLRGIDHVAVVVGPPGGPAALVHHHA